MDTTQLAESVRRAQAGDRQAATALVHEFQDLVSAVCVGHTGDLDLARDAAQDTFVTALGALASLREPMAFPAWLLRIARTCSRKVRPPEVTPDPLLPDQPGPEVHDPGEEVAVVHAGLASLRPADRMVLALAYLGGYAHAEIAEFLGLSVSTVKKRAFDARRRLRGILPVVEARLAASRPSQTAAFSDVILLYAAIRRGDAKAVSQLVGADPTLAEAEETWEVEEGRSAGLIFPDRATPLVRAAEAGHLDIVEVLLGAGASIDGPCGCETAETPLWAATANGQAGVVGRLLAGGADPNRTAGPGVTPLHIAVARGRPDLADLLLDAGAEADRADDSGRTANDWAVLRRDDGSVAVGPIVPVGIKVLDLLAPLPRGGLVYWHGSYGLGQQVLLGEIATALAPVPITWLGFECDLLDRTELAHLQAEAGLADDAFAINLLPPHLGPDDRSTLLEAAVHRLERRATLQPQVVVVVDHPDLTATLEAYLPRLRGMAGLLVTIFLSPRFAAELSDDRLPDGFDAQVVLDPERARRRLWPAVDLRRSRSDRYSSARHQALAGGVRTAVEAESVLARQLHAYLTQPLRVGQPFLGTSAQPASLDDLLADVEALLSGSHGDTPTETLLYQGAGHLATIARD